MPASLLALLIASLASCGEGDPTSPQLPADCGALSELPCINSSACTLVLADGGVGVYLCREAADACERGFRQRTDTRAACEAKPGCRFVPGVCYCPPDVTCVCGGGPPPRCESASENASAASLLL